MLIETNTFPTIIEPNLKRETEAIFKQLDLSPIEAINLFYEQVCLRQQLPFELKTPNKITLEAMEDARLRRNLISAKSVEDIFDNIEDDLGGLPTRWSRGFSRCVHADPHRLKSLLQRSKWFYENLMTPITLPK